MMFSGWRLLPLFRRGVCWTRWLAGRADPLPDVNYNRLIQLLYLESSRLVLDAVFSPPDRTNSTGPVVGGVHDALRRLRHHWEGQCVLRVVSKESALGTAWLLKIDLVGLNRILYNPRLEKSLLAKVEPGRFLELVKRLGGTNAVLTQSAVHAHLTQLDLLIARIQHDCQAQRNRRIHPLVKRAPELLDPASIKETKFERLGSLTMGDKNFVRMRYVRHADEILVGIAANRPFAEKVSQRICSYIGDALKLEYQASLTHVSEEPAPMFLGIRVAPYPATKFARRFVRELESRRRIRKRVMLRAAQREAAWNNKLRKVQTYAALGLQLPVQCIPQLPHLALSALATGLKKTRRMLGPRDARQAMVDKCTELAQKFVLDPANVETCRHLLRDAQTIEKTFAEELGWISLPFEVREAHKHLTAVIRKHIQSMR